MDHKSSTDAGSNRHGVLQHLVEGEKSFKDMKENIWELIGYVEWSKILLHSVLQRRFRVCALLLF